MLDEMSLESKVGGGSEVEYLGGRQGENAV